MIIDGFVHQLPDIDPGETQEWLDSLDAVVDTHGKTRARFLVSKLLERARELQVGAPATVSTPYVNSIPPEQEPFFPGDEDVERRIRAFIRWNAAVMVVKANHAADGIGGHLATFASSAALYEVGFNHFFRGKDDGLAGDHVYIQGHAAPGIYARAFLEGRLTAEQLDHFRREVGGNGLSSYPHPRLMPDFWEYPTVSMGLGPLSSIYQARFNKYLHNRKLEDTSNSRVWCFIGDGECDEPETLGSISLAAREALDNLTWVVNCNLQRLDGPVRGNGKIIQELEAVFRGAGWNVIKVVWGSKWDELLLRDVDGVLLNKMNSTVDGEFQRYAVESGAYAREHFFGPDPRLRKMVEHLSDEDIRNLPRGGHDYRKLYAAYKAATEQEGAPTVILAKTIKGWTLGPDVEGRNATHQIKKMTTDQFRLLRERLHLQEEVPEEALGDGKEPPYITLPERLRDPRVHGPASHRPRRLLARSASSGRSARSSCPPTRRSTSSTPAPASRRRRPPRRSRACCATCAAIPSSVRGSCRSSPTRPARSAWTRCSRSSGSTPRRASTTSRSTTTCCSRTRRRQSGQILEEGITEAGGLASFIAAGTSYATHGVPMVPFFTFYSMFGFQRVGDLIWQATDARARGFLLGATAGRTTLLGEGLQHQDGHSLLLASVNPAIEAYDPAFAYEVATIVHDGLRRMYQDGEDVIYYLTLYNENQVMPPRADGVADGVVEGLYRWADAPDGAKHPATILFSGSANLAAREAQAQLAEHYDVGAELFSATSYKRLREQALTTERWNRLHPDQTRADGAGHRAPRGRGARRRGHRLHEGHPRPGRPVGPRGPELHAARHRRVRAQRHPGGVAPLLRDRRAAHRRGHARRTGRRRRGEGGSRHRCHQPVRARSRGRRPAAALIYLRPSSLRRPASARRSP